MLGSPRIVAIDDQREHLTGLASCLNRNGVACLQICFAGDAKGIKACPNVRVIFADLQLVAGAGSDHTKDFATIGGLIEDTIKPVGPYYIVLWTRYPDQAPALMEFLSQRLGRDVTGPFGVHPLSKSEHIDSDGSISNDEKLMEAISNIVRGSPQVGALFEWEGRVMGATGRTVASIFDLAPAADTGERSDRLGKILGHLGMEAVGRPHLATNQFRAINEALLPILADRITGMRLEGHESELWRAALKIPARRAALSVEEAARLNRLVHIAHAEGTSPSARGVVVPLPDSYRADFCDHFGISETKAAGERFRCKKYDSDSSCFRWVLIQCQPACDYAQSNAGSLPYYLGLDFPEEHRSKGGKLPQSTWRGPAFELDGEIRRLRVNSGFPLALAASAVQPIKPLYRLREQLLNGLVYHLHSHAARPGMMSFGEM